MVVRSVDGKSLRYNENATAFFCNSYMCNELTGDKLCAHGVRCKWIGVELAKLHHPVARPYNDGTQTRVGSIPARRHHHRPSRNPRDPIPEEKTPKLETRLLAPAILPCDRNVIALCS